MAHLVESLYKGDLQAAVQKAVKQLDGIYALVLMHRDEPQKLVAARMGPPLVVGLADGERFLASDIPAILPYTRQFLFLEDGDVVTVTPGAHHIVDADGQPVTREPQQITWDPVQAEKGGYRHFMLKEIHEQPRAVRDTLLGRIGLEEGEVHLEELGAAAAELKRAKRVMLLACGTSWHAALVGKYLLEQVAGVPAEVDYGSEFRYRTPLVGPESLAVAITPERRDRRHPGRLQGSQAPRGPAHRDLQRAGLAGDARGRGHPPHPRRARDRRRLHQGLHRADRGPGAAGPAPRAGCAGRLSNERCRELLESLARVPHLMENALAMSGRVEEVAKWMATARDFLYLGRGVNYPIALEGALKMKEISYIHAEGYPAGEMKHGPIALIDESMPVVALCPKGRTYDKMLSNIQEVKARGGRVIAITFQGDTEVRKILDKGTDLIFDVPAGRRGVVPAAHGPAPAAAWPTTSRCARGATSTSRATSPSPSRSSRPPTDVA